MSKRLFRQERLHEIVEKVLADKTVYVDDLAKQFGVSPSSIRIDLAELEARGVLNRTHGGAIIADKAAGHIVTQNSPLELRVRSEVAEKEAIGRAAAALIGDGDTFMIDGGSTTLRVVQHLKGKRSLTVITNAVTLLPELMRLPDAQLYVTGGLLDLKLSTLLGDLAVDSLGRFRTAKAIIGIDGISLRGGLTVSNPFVAAAKRKMIDGSRKLIVVADHTKLERVCLIALAGITEMAVLVTDESAPQDVVDAVRASGPEVIVAPID
jgi:DeoR/GlpR family transcriptional regulator of sugar metabolism